ncbi:hypothetical protein TRIUR3_26075 [Triticum urartu]|uniref:Uncharacterized protein n=1 Tax=Triticum urartu TaxID=4572 RepID=M7ZCN3_TRIUA|nr:hypothetical protein TRIUR3_26075 [Triticum urartu]
MEQEEGRRKRQAAAVVALECVAGSSKAEEWGGGGVVVQEGDVVESVRVGLSSGAGSLDAPFKGGRAGLHKALHKAFLRGDTSVDVRVPGGKDLQACILPHPGGAIARKQYVLGFGFGVCVIFLLSQSGPTLSDGLNQDPWLCGNTILYENVY